MYYIINTITGETYKTESELLDLFQDLINRDKAFKLVDLFQNKLTDLKIVSVD